MDLSRRLAAGELAELFGAVARAAGREGARFSLPPRCRRGACARCRPSSARCSAPIRAGLMPRSRASRSRPWEYWVLGSAPAPWRAEDTILVSYAMWWDLQYGGFESELAKRRINAELSGPRVRARLEMRAAVFLPRAHGLGQSESAVTPASPLRRAARSPRSRAAARSARAARAHAPGGQQQLGARGPPDRNRRRARGKRHASQSARADRVVSRAAAHHARSASAAGLDLNGVTLPGAPLLVAGSNGHVAWAFTNSAGKWLDLAADRVRGASATAAAAHRARRAALER